MGPLALLPANPQIPFPALYPLPPLQQRPSASLSLHVFLSVHPSFLSSLSLHALMSVHPFFFSRSIFFRPCLGLLETIPTLKQNCYRSYNVYPSPCTCVICMRP